MATLEQNITRIANKGYSLLVAVFAIISYSLFCSGEKSLRPEQAQSIGVLEKPYQGNEDSVICRCPKCGYEISCELKEIKIIKNRLDNYSQCFK